MYHALITTALAILCISTPLLIIWALHYADKVDERRWVAQERAREAGRKAARLRALDAWAAERSARLADLGSDEKDVDP
jgi:hypothetical protein